MGQPIELILVRHLASRLTIPTLLTDVEGTLVFYNEAAEPLLGRRFDEAGEMPFNEWTSVYSVRDKSGQLVRSEEIPLVHALRSRRPIHVRMEITGLDGTPMMLEVSAFPLMGQGDQRLGAVTLFWESEAEDR